jgi:hypothetical protein
LLGGHVPSEQRVLVVDDVHELLCWVLLRRRLELMHQLCCWDVPVSHWVQRMCWVLSGIVLDDGEGHFVGNMPQLRRRNLSITVRIDGVYGLRSWYFVRDYGRIFFNNLHELRQWTIRILDRFVGVHLMCRGNVCRGRGSDFLEVVFELRCRYLLDCRIE